MTRILLLLLTLAIFSCERTAVSEQSFQVEYKGALKNIMHKDDLSAKVDLSDYQGLKNVYALGAIENLKGEIQIFNSQPFNSIVQNGRLEFDSSYNKRATLLVSAIVKDWVSIPIPNHVHTKQNLEQYIETTAAKHKIDVHQPFPFLIEGVVEELSWHVINWKDGDKEHTHKKHIQSGLNGMIQQEKVKMLGFYSDAHHAIFTHHTTNMHIHVQSNNGKIAGHVDDLKIGKAMYLKLPKAE